MLMVFGSDLGGQNYLNVNEIGLKLCVCILKLTDTTCSCLQVVQLIFLCSSFDHTKHLLFCWL